MTTDHSIIKSLLPVFVGRDSLTIARPRRYGPEQAISLASRVWAGGAADLLVQHLARRTGWQIQAKPGGMDEFLCTVLHKVHGSNFEKSRIAAWLFHKN